MKMKEEQKIKGDEYSGKKAIRAYVWMEMTVALQDDEKYRKDETQGHSKYNVIISALWGKSSS